MQLLFNKRTETTGFIIILIFLNCLGFPGNFSVLTGEIVETIFEYFCFLLVILLIFRTSGFPVISVSHFAVPVYLFLTIIFVESMIVTNYPSLELISCIRFTVMALFGLWLAENYDVMEILELVCSAQFVFLIATVIFVIIWPEEGFQNTTIVVSALSGLFTTKNACGSELAFGIVATALYIKLKMLKKENNKVALYVFLFGQILLLLLTQSLGPLICAAVACVYIFVFYNRKINPGLMFIVVSIAFLYVALNFMSYFGNALLFLGKDSTLTGRIDLWNQIIDVMSENNTFTGFGYAMFWRDESAYALLHAGFSEYSFLGNMTSGSHNLILDWWLNTGLIGIIAFFLMIITTMNKVGRSKTNSRLFVSTIMIVFTLHGLSERGMDASSYSTLLLFISIGVAIAEKTRQLSEELINEDELDFE